MGLLLIHDCMKLPLILIFIFSVVHIQAQIINGDFNEWVIIDSTGQPYEDLVAWETNNIGLGNGFATSPNIKIQEGNDIGVSVRSEHEGIDGNYSGVISQVINAENLYRIEYLSRCDSIYERGACVVNLYDEMGGLVYTDSITSKEHYFSLKVLDISDIQELNSSMLKVEFKAFGQIGAFEDFLAYAKWDLLHVAAEYTSGSNAQSESLISIFPNPFDEQINISTIEKQKVRYSIYDLQGQLHLKGEASLIDTGRLPTGMYVIHVQYGEEIITKMLLKHS